MKILPGVPASKPELVERFFAAFAAGDVDRALALATDDVVLDRSHSKGPFRGVARGHEEVRVATAEYRDPLGGMTWAPKRVRAVGRDLAVVETEVSIEGRSSGINVIAHGGWLARFEGDLIAEGVLHQSYEEPCSRRGVGALAAARLYFVCEAQPAGADPAELLGAAIAGGVDVIQLREKAPRCAEELIAFADPFARAARERGALFFLNDEPELVERCDADGVHVGQDDEPVAAARAAAGAGALVGLSTHSAGADRRGAGGRRRRPPRPDQRRAGLGDADEAGPAGGRARAGRARGRGPPATTTVVRDRRDRRDQRRRGGRGGGAADRRGAGDPRRARPRGRRA